ncbi:hypothetical protein TCAL_03174 [Tigriopus californicus]|uniref:Uncharacterized protein n=1 Tax=Tigriopus californicus TaxID=6832 RepID=A0A553N8Z1_TIGCA|nr:uncharacterized protein LOC131885298 [Tigriopus californicus]TRY61880.1 hypothetical protein TCAL_03174 [Tigriopus californicus]|eukprot:TCALIF_03174-PA protein Name:"Protein of unknown function" AED:0.12 eAED:0.12 QI:774/1/1/1/1/1/2/187/162
MNRLANTNLDKQMRKIEKSQEKAVKILTKQRRDLTKAIQDNEKLIEQHMAKGTPAEIKLESEIEKLAKRLETMKEEMVQVRIRREERLAPLKDRSEHLKEQLKLVESQLDSTFVLRERRSQSRIELDNLNGNLSTSPQFMSQQTLNEDYMPSSPPPYSPYSS